MGQLVRADFNQKVAFDKAEASCSYVAKGQTANGKARRTRHRRRAPRRTTGHPHDGTRHPTRRGADLQVGA